MVQPVIALLFDFDDTLAPDSTTYLLREGFGLSSKEIKNLWNKVTQMVKSGWDPPIAYMTEILSLVKNNGVELTKEKMHDIGSKLKPFAGLPKMFKELPQFIEKIDDFKNNGIRLEFYVITGGIEEFIKGNPIAKHMTAIFGCTFDYNKTGQPSGIKSAISFTEKTRFLFGIHKGFSENELRSEPYVVNDAIESGERRVPLSNMIYIGDGPSDIPCFSVVKKAKGNTIGIRKPRKQKKEISKGYELARGERITQGPYKADYSNGSELREAIEDAIRAVGYKIVAKLREHRINSPKH